MLFDTPGFDDTYRLDAEILQELAEHLAASYRNNLKLSGVVYLHRIKDERMTNAIMRNLTMFKNLCGDSGLENTILATTFWDELPNVEKGEKREEELASNKKYWGYMLSKGAKMRRCANTRESVLDILRELASKPRITLQIQDEMAVRGYGINETKAGEALNAEIAELKKKHDADMAQLKREMEEARRSGEVELQETLRELQREKEAQVNRLLNEQEAMKADRREEMRRLTQAFNDQIFRLEMERKERENRVRQLEERLTDERADSERRIRAAVEQSNEVMQNMKAMMERATSRDREEYERKFEEMKEQRRRADREVEEWRREVRMLNERIAQLAAAHGRSGRDEKVKIEEEMEELEGRKKSRIQKILGVLGNIATIGLPILGATIGIPLFNPFASN